MSSLNVWIMMLFHVVLISISRFELMLVKKARENNNIIIGRTENLGKTKNSAKQCSEPLFFIM